MDFPALATFVAVAEHGSFSRAAESMFTTQPAVSKRVRALEDELGVTLIDRLGRGIRLTEAGETFLASSRRLLADARANREEVRTLGGTVTGRLRLGTSHHVGIHRLPPVLKAFTQAHPEVTLDLLFMDSEQACAAVADGALELAIVTLPDREDAALETALVWSDPLRIVAAPDHPLLAEAPLDPRALARHPAVLPARGTVTRTILLDALARFDVAIETSLETNYLETIKMMVSVGLGWSALPESMADGGVVAVEVEGLEMARRLGSVTQRGRTLSRAARAMVGSLGGCGSRDVPTGAENERCCPDRCSPSRAGSLSAQSGGPKSVSSANGASVVSRTPPAASS